MKTGVVVRLISREIKDFDLLAKVKAKLFLDKDVTDYDTLIQDEAKRAIEVVENFTGLGIGPQVRKISYSVLTEETELLYGPYRSTVSVSSGGYIDADGNLTADWSTGGSVTFNCGYTPDDVPAGLLSAVVLAAAEFTGLLDDLKPNGWRALAAPFRIFTWAD